MLRSGTRRWPPKNETLNEAKTEKKVNPKTGRMAQHYACVSCGTDFPRKEVEIDHILPAVGPAGFTSWDDFIEKLFCGPDNLQCLCLPCHKLKSGKEREERNAKKPPRKSIR